MRPLSVNALGGDRLDERTIERILRWTLALILDRITMPNIGTWLQFFAVPFIGIIVHIITDQLFTQIW